MSKHRAAEPGRRRGTTKAPSAAQARSGRRRSTRTTPTRPNWTVTVGLLAVGLAAVGAGAPTAMPDLFADGTNVSYANRPNLLDPDAFASATSSLQARRRAALSRGFDRSAATGGPALGDEIRRRNAALARLDDLAAERARDLAANLWVSPVSGYHITATFGQASYLWSSVHTGIDLAAPTGTRIGSVAAGVVTYAGYDGSYGNKVVVQHADGTETWYAHMTSISVSVGESVAAGEQVGTVGSTGNVTGPHLHLEVRPGGGDPVDPRPACAEHGLYL